LVDTTTGKQWHDTKKPFRPTSGQTSYALRKAQDVDRAVTKANEKEMKEAKETERQVRYIQTKSRSETFNDNPFLVSNTGYKR